MAATGVGPLRRKGRMTAGQRRQRARREAVQGRRPSQSASAVRRVLQGLREVVGPGGPVVLETDRKALYGRLGREVFGGRLRHFLARLRRRAWCVTKRRGRLQEHLRIAALWVNDGRGITNRTRTTPAQALGLAGRAYRPEEARGRRQDGGRVEVRA